MKRLFENLIKLLSGTVLMSLLLFLNGCNSSTGSSSKKFIITFKNSLYTDITVTLTGKGTDVVSPGDSITFTLNDNPGTFSYTAETSGETSTGGQIGLLITWDYSDIDVSALESKTITLILSSSYFFMKMQNTGTVDLNPIYVNYGLADETNDNILIPHNSVVYSCGYYKAFANTQVRAYVSGNSTYIYWDQGNHFTFPGVANQSVTFLNTYKVIPGTNVAGKVLYENSKMLESDGMMSNN